jgi:hypothetical protein
MSTTKPTTKPTSTKRTRYTAPEYADPRLVELSHQFDHMTQAELMTERNHRVNVGDWDAYRAITYRLTVTSPLCVS